MQNMLSNSNVENFRIWHLVKTWISCRLLRPGLSNLVSWCIRGPEWKGHCDLLCSFSFKTVLDAFYGEPEDNDQQTLLIG